VTAPAPGWLAQQLPVAMLQDEFLVRFVAIFEEVAGTLVHSVDTIGGSADLSITPDSFVPWLGSWIDATADPRREDPDSAAERDWIRAQASTLAVRGTLPGLERVLRELSGGHPVQISDSGGIYREGQCPPDAGDWVRVQLPLAEGISTEDVLALIRAEVPVGVGVDLVALPLPGTGSSPLIPQQRDEFDEADAAPEFLPDLWDGSPASLPPEFLTAREPAAEPAAALSGADRRLPGTGGRAGLPARICPVCAEHNEGGVQSCRRCHSPMRIVPVEPIPEPEPAFVFPEPDLWLPERRIWPVVALVVALVLGTLLACAFLLS
jgi:phage tail-like protein